MSDNLLQRALRIGNGNPGAITVLATIHREFADEFVFILDKLEQREIRGSDVWLMFKKDADQKMERFLMIFREGEQDCPKQDLNLRS